jgi:hypothetical protein
MACNENASDQKAKQGKGAIRHENHNVSGTGNVREDIHQPVAVFEQNMQDKVTDNDFIVKVFPDSIPNQYRLEIHYGGNEAQDNVTMLPRKYYKKIELRKGETDQECIFGFRDTEGKFNEMKLISVSGTQISIKTLRTYYLSTQ